MKPGVRPSLASSEVFSTMSSTVSVIASLSPTLAVAVAVVDLPSIAAVSDVVLKTCQLDKGILVHIKGGKIVETTLCEARKGTSICVTNLFYNTPARLKHLSSINSELSNIIDVCHGETRKLAELAEGLDNSIRTFKL